MCSIDGPRYLDSGRNELSCGDCHSRGIGCHAQLLLASPLHMARSNRIQLQRRSSSTSPLSPKQWSRFAPGQYFADVFACAGGGTACRGSEHMRHSDVCDREFSVERLVGIQEWSEFAVKSVFLDRFAFIGYFSHKQQGTLYKRNINECRSRS